MDTVHDHCGGQIAVSSAKFTLLFMSLLCLFACNKPFKTAKKKVVIKSDTAHVQNKTVAETKTIKTPQKKKLYITFDDGPNKGTKNVLDIINDEEISVSFFVVGEHVFASRYQADIWDSMRISKHIEICNHSFSHAHH